MRRGWSDEEIVRGLRSPDETERHRAVGAFVRRYGCSAPVELVLTVTGVRGRDWQYRRDRSLVEQLLETADVDEEVRMTWRVALLEGEGLARAVGEFDRRHGPALRERLKRVGADGDDVYQDFLLRLLRDRTFRLRCLGNYAGEGPVVSYLWTMLRREAFRRARARTGKSGELNEQMEERRDGPSVALERTRMRAGLRTALRDMNSDAGLVAFLLEQGLGLTSVETAEVLGLNENTVRQRTFRFRERFRSVWRRLNGSDSEPFGWD